MTPFARFANRFWFGGCSLAAIGVVLARVIAPTLERGPQQYVAVAGELLAIVGLFVIAYGVSRRVRSGTPEGGVTSEKIQN